MQKKKAKEPKQGSFQQKNLTLTVGTWNTRSLNCLKKVSSLLKLNQNIVLVQEVWNPSSDILKIFQDKNFFIKRRPDGYGGSGILINDDRLKPLSDPIQMIHIY